MGLQLLRDCHLSHIRTCQTSWTCLRLLLFFLSVCLIIPGIFPTIFACQGGTHSTNTTGVLRYWPCLESKALQTACMQRIPILKQPLSHPLQKWFCNTSIFMGVLPCRLTCNEHFDWMGPLWCKIPRLGKEMGEFYVRELHTVWVLYFEIWVVYGDSN